MTDVRNRQVIARCLTMALGLALTGLGLALLLSLGLALAGVGLPGPTPVGGPFALLGGYITLALALGHSRHSQAAAILLTVLAAAMLPVAARWSGLPPALTETGVLPGLPVALMLLSTGYLLAARARPPITIIRILTLALMLYGLANFFAAALSLPAWARLTRLPDLNLLTALFVVAATSVLALVPSLGPVTYRRHYRTVLVIGLIGVVLTTTSWYLSRYSNQQVRVTQAEHLARQTADNLNAYYRNESAINRNLAERLERAGANLTEATWQRETSRYLEDFLHIELFGLMDQNGRIQQLTSRNTDASSRLDRYLADPVFQKWLRQTRSRPDAYAGEHRMDAGTAELMFISTPVSFTPGPGWTLLSASNLDSLLARVGATQADSLVVIVADEQQVLMDTGDGHHRDLRQLAQRQLELHQDSYWTVTVSEPLATLSIAEYISEMLILFGGLALTTLLMINRLFGLVMAERNTQLAVHLAREKQLREFNDRIITFSSDLLCIIDGEGFFQFVSPASKRILGYNPKEMVGRRAREFVASEDREASLRVVTQMRARDKSAPPQFRNRYLHKDGHPVTLTWKARRSDEDNSIFCVGRDITAELKAEELSRQREAFFSLTPEMFCIVSPENRFIEVNQAFVSVLGYARADLIGQPYLDLIHAHYHDVVKDAVLRLVRGETIYDLEVEAIHKQGAQRWLRLNASYSDDRLIYCAARDITTERHAREELRANEQLLRMAEQIGRLGGWMVDVETGQLTWSDAVCDIHEVPPGQEPAIDEAIRFYTPESRPVVEQAVRQGIELGLPFDLEARIQTATGRYRWVRLMGQAVRNPEAKVVALQGAFQDISAGKEANEQIRRLAERQSRIFESITDAFFTLDREWRFTFMNAKCEELLQRPRADVVGESLWEVFPEAIGTDFDEYYRQAMETGQTASFEAYFLPLDLWAEVKAYPSEDGIAVYFRSINERKRAEQELQDTLDELERSNRELQDFAFVASHDLQEPLRKIQTFGDRLLKNADHFDERERDYLTRMQSAASRMQSLIMDLLSYSRVSTRAQPFTDCDLNDILEGVLQDLESAISSSHATINVQPLPQVKGDPTQLRQVLQNLLSNAIKFRRPDVEPEIVVYPESSGDQGWTLVVQDNGTGFDPRYAERMFQPFQRLHSKNEYAGTGIGLAIVRKIIDRHNAVIVADGRPGKGSIFRIHFSRESRTEPPAEG